MRVLLSALFVALLTACAASPHRLGYDAMQRSDWSTAERQLTIAVQRGDSSAWNDLGVAYHREGKIQAAIDAFNMGARYGDPTARANLARNKLPIPAADLAPTQPASSTEGIAAALDGFNRGYQGGSVTCTSFGSDDMRRINCR